jgi:hypothetical protein
MPPRVSKGAAAAAAAASAPPPDGPLEVRCQELGAWFDCEVVKPAAGGHELALSDAAHCMAAGASFCAGAKPPVAPAQQLRRRSEAAQDSDCDLLVPGTRTLCLMRRGGGAAPLWLDATLVRAARFPHRASGECQARRAPCARWAPACRCAVARVAATAQQP